MGQIIWTTELTEELKRLYTTNSAAEIAAKLGNGLSRCAIIGKARRLGLALPVRVKAEPKPRSPRAPRNRSGERHAIFKVVRMNGNSDRMKVIQTSKFVERPTLRCVEVVPRHLSLMDLGPDDCRYPYGGDQVGEPMTFCGNLVQTDSSWCPSHHAICMLPPAPRRDQSRKYFGTDFGKRVFG